MKIPYLTTNELEKMRVEDLDNFDLEFDSWLEKTTFIKREQRKKLEPIKYKMLILETLNRKGLLC